MPLTGSRDTESFGRNSHCASRKLHRENGRSRDERSRSKARAIKTFPDDPDAIPTWRLNCTDDVPTDPIVLPFRKCEIERDRSRAEAQSEVAVS